MSKAFGTGLACCRQDGYRAQVPRHHIEKYNNNIKYLISFNINLDLFDSVYNYWSD